MLVKNTQKEKNLYIVNQRLTLDQLVTNIYVRPTLPHCTKSVDLDLLSLKILHMKCVRCFYYFQWIFFYMNLKIIWIKMTIL